MDHVVFFPTCVIDAIEPEMGMAACRVLQEAGVEVEVPDDATCCGQPAWNSGQAGAAAQVARNTLRALAATTGDIVVPAGSCATMMRIFWPELFSLEGSQEEQQQVDAVAARTYEWSEYVHTRDIRPLAGPDPTPTVYHRSCHMLRELGIVEEPEELLAAAASDVRSAGIDDRCCGFGGVFSVKLPEVSVAMADEVLDAYQQAGAERVVGCDASCLMHLRGRASRRGLVMTFQHLAEVMDPKPETGA